MLFIPRKGYCALFLFCLVSTPNASSVNTSLPSSADNFTTNYWESLLNCILRTLRAQGIKKIVSLWREGISGCLCFLFLMPLLYPSLLSSQIFLREQPQHLVLHLLYLKYCSLKANYKTKIYVFINRYAEWTQFWHFEKPVELEFYCSLICRLKHSQMKGYMEERSFVFSTSSLPTFLWPAILRPTKCQCLVDILLSLLIISYYFCDFFTCSFIQVSAVTVVGGQQ